MKCNLKLWALWLAIVGIQTRNGVAAATNEVASISEQATNSHQIGEFGREGEYVKDNFFLKEGDTYHLFYNVGKAAPKQDWDHPGNEEAFGHATSKDLKSWTYHERVLPIVPDTWEGKAVSAPSIVQHDGLFYMVYTGFDDRVHGKQSIGLATSKDLFKWDRYPCNPVYTKPDWAMAYPNGWVDCRDAHIEWRNSEFLLYTMVTTKEGKGAIALASSPDAHSWADLGPVLITFRTPESPRVFEHDGTYYMFASSSFGKKLFKSKDPKSENWEEVPFQWPSPGLWSGWETLQDGSRTLFSAFKWQMNGNFIRYWEVEWHGETPVVKY